MVRTRRFQCRGSGSIPGQRTKIPQALRCDQKQTQMACNSHGLWPQVPWYQGQRTELSAQRRLHTPQPSAAELPPPRSPRISVGSGGQKGVSCPSSGSSAPVPCFMGHYSQILLSLDPKNSGYETLPSEELGHWRTRVSALIWSHRSCRRKLTAGVLGASIDVQGVTGRSF